MRWTERARGSLPMHANTATVEVLDLGDVVRDVVNDADTIRGARTDDALEHLANSLGEDLPVAPREIGGGTHRAKVIAPFARRERSASKLSIRQLDTVASQGLVHRSDVIGADLMPEATRAGVDEHRELAGGQLEGSGRILVEHFFDDLHLEEMIAAPQRAELIASSLLGACRDEGRIGIAQ